MKKLMIAVAIVCAAVMAQAATANWRCSAANVYDGTGATATANKYTGSAYFFDADSLSQAALFAIIEAADSTFDITKQTGYVATGTIAAGSMAVASNTFSKFDQGSGDHSFYFALIEDDRVYLSATKTAAASGTDSPVTLAFGNQNPTTGAKSSALPTDGFVSAGQWASIPEPTSGLLMLLGMAGLALRRRRA